MVRWSLVWTLKALDAPEAGPCLVGLRWLLDPDEGRLSADQKQYRALLPTLLREHGLHGAG